MTTPDNEAPIPQGEEGAASAEAAPSEEEPKKGKRGAKAKKAKGAKKGKKEKEPKPPIDLAKVAEPAEPEALASVNLRAAVEAVLFAADDPASPAQIAKAVGGVSSSIARKALDELASRYESTGSGLAIEELAGGYTILTREDFAPMIRRLRKATEGRKLTGAALETLSVVAYKQPVQRQEIEDVRGVSCGPVLRGLMEQGLVKIVGRAEQLGRPLLYGTTKRFLDVFGLGSLRDLPKATELGAG